MYRTRRKKKKQESKKKRKEKFDQYLESEHTFAFGRFFLFRLTDFSPLGYSILFRFEINA